MYSIPKIELTATELALVAQKLDDPLIKKYLIFLARPLIAAIILNGDTPPLDSGETMETWKISVNRFRGQVEALEHLISIEAAPIAGDSES